MNANFRAGVVSATLRQYAFKNFIKHVIKTDLSCIEWGSDIHVPYNDLNKAADVAAEMARNNLVAASYGSYYKLGRLPFQQDDGEKEKLFNMILNTAKILGAPMIRVWGGVRGSDQLDAEARQEIIEDALAIAAIAQQENIDISLEYHKDTITDTAESALDFINKARDSGGSNIYLYWQANSLLSFTENKNELIQVLPFVSNVHVQAREGNKRLTLAEHKHHWQEYIDIIKSDGRKHDFLIEFTPNDSPECFVEDAKVLVDLLGVI